MTGGRKTTKTKFCSKRSIFEDLGDNFVKRIKASGGLKDRVVEKGLLKNDKGYVESLHGKDACTSQRTRSYERTS